MSRRFLKYDDTREDANVYGIQVVKSVGECSFMCTMSTQQCVGFNYNPGPPIMCELSRVPHDAPDAHMVNDPNWDHYAIIPW